MITQGPYKVALAYELAKAGEAFVTMNVRWFLAAQ
jgi:hypothetical protein